MLRLKQLRTKRGMSQSELEKLLVLLQVLLECMNKEDVFQKYRH